MSVSFKGLFSHGQLKAAIWWSTAFDYFMVRLHFSESWCVGTNIISVRGRCPGECGCLKPSRNPRGATRKGYKTSVKSIWLNIYYLAVWTTFPVEFKSAFNAFDSENDYGCSTVTLYPCRGLQIATWGNWWNGRKIASSVAVDAKRPTFLDQSTYNFGTPDKLFYQCRNATKQRVNSYNKVLTVA